MSNEGGSNKNERLLNMYGNPSMHKQEHSQSYKKFKSIANIAKSSLFDKRSTDHMSTQHNLKPSVSYLHNKSANNLQTSYGSHLHPEKDTTEKKRSDNLAYNVYTRQQPHHSRLKSDVQFDATITPQKSEYFVRSSHDSQLNSVKSKKYYMPMISTHSNEKDETVPVRNHRMYSPKTLENLFL